VTPPSTIASPGGLAGASTLAQLAQPAPAAAAVPAAVDDTPVPPPPPPTRELRHRAAASQPQSAAARQLGRSSKEGRNAVLPVPLRCPHCDKACSS
jgi:hypothetical protein